MIFVVQFFASSSFSSRISLWPIFSGVVDCVFDDGGFRWSFLILFRIKKSHEIGIFVSLVENCEREFLNLRIFYNFGKNGQLVIWQFLIFYCFIESVKLRFLSVYCCDKRKIFYCEIEIFYLQVAKIGKKRLSLIYKKYLHDFSSLFND